MVCCIIDRAVLARPLAACRRARATSRPRVNRERNNPVNNEPSRHNFPDGLTFINVCIIHIYTMFPHKLSSSTWALCKATRTRRNVGEVGMEIIGTVGKVWNTCDKQVRLIRYCRLVRSFVVKSELQSRSKSGTVGLPILCTVYKRQTYTGNKYDLHWLVEPCVRDHGGGQGGRVARTVVHSRPDH